MSRESLADELMDGVLDRFNLRAATESFTTIAEADKWLVERVDALEAERDDELGEAEPDAEWLRDAARVITRANKLLAAVRQSRRTLCVAHDRERGHLEVRTFARLVKERVGDEAYLALWQRAREETP